MKKNGDINLVFVVPWFPKKSGWIKLLLELEWLRDPQAWLGIGLGSLTAYLLSNILQDDAKQ